MPEGLTKQQARAMLAFLWAAGREGFDNEACDGAVWDNGVRPWPTMDNLEQKGLVRMDAWYGPEEGRLWALTEEGREYMRGVVRERAAA